MAKVVSAVPKLLTNTIGAIASDPPKPAVIATPAPLPAAVPPETDKTVADTTIAGPDLTTDLNDVTTRSRGRLGTIATSFRGVLNDGASTLSRRTLLGE